MQMQLYNSLLTSRKLAVVAIDTTGVTNKDVLLGITVAIVGCTDDSLQPPKYEEIARKTFFVRSSDTPDLSRSEPFNGISPQLYDAMADSPGAVRSEIVTYLHEHSPAVVLSYNIPFMDKYLISGLALPLEHFAISVWDITALERLIRSKIVIAPANLPRDMPKYRHDAMHPQNVRASIEAAMDEVGGAPIDAVMQRHAIITNRPGSVIGSTFRVHQCIELLLKMLPETITLDIK